MEKDAPESRSSLQSKLRLPLTITTNIESPEVKEAIQNSNKVSPTSVKDVKDIILSSSKNILGKVLSPSKDKLSQNTKKSEKVDKVEKKPVLMTRRELTDPFGSDEEEETIEVAIPDNNKIENKTCNDNNSDKKREEVDNKAGDVNSDLNKIELPKPTQVI